MQETKGKGWAEKKNLLVPENPERPNGRKKERKMEGKKTEKMMRKQ